MRCALAVFLVAAGCREGTSVLVRVDQGDVAIPADVAALHVRVTNPELSVDAATFDSQLLPLCAAGATSDCFTLPLSVTLRPGDSSPDTLVRAEVTALDAGGNEVITDAAEFHFASGQETALDFYLSKACLQSTCAASGQLCGRSGGCEIGTTTASSSPPDLATAPATQPVTRWAENTSNNPDGVQPMWVLPKPANAATGDLIIAAVTNGVPPAGWSVVTEMEMDSVLLAYHRVGAAETDADYTFTAPALLEASWTYASYRGVAQVLVGGVSAADANGGFAFPSLDVPANGSLLTTWISSSVDPQCTFDGALMEFNSDLGSLDEQTLGAGPSGERTYACTLADGPIYGAQILLVP